MPGPSYYAGEGGGRQLPARDMGKILELDDKREPVAFVVKVTAARGVEEAGRLFLQQRESRRSCADLSQREARAADSAADGSPRSTERASSRDETGDG